jgi:hypothetical protein
MYILGLFKQLQTEGAWVNISPVGVAEVVFAVSVVFNSSGFCNSPKASVASKKTLNLFHSSVELRLRCGLVVTECGSVLDFKLPIYRDFWPLFYWTF